MSQDEDAGKNQSGNLIDQNLKKVFDDVLNEELPDRLTNLLAQLRASENSEDGSGEAGK
ncbi:NepR family anti-sigma factor [Litoreibacter roseus]|uniref:Anti-sigma factor NepR domain-containing protein n=1 Tax=Litoreibacter roseus TaxID=2601869 RepID=A0A6N6JJ09_9RHOB|nr:NepR family anti-sigma factor [Litoreibacter roseus]GFE66114.1 hypothetical protein KIN_31880 [Litoreibacter roseus]